ncbi:MAG: AmmeMemoRadiSam system protein A [Bacteroidales bacterium]
MEFTEKQKHTLMSMAEWSIQNYLTTGKRDELPDKFEIDPVFKSPRGVFVSVYIKSDLRGCIGTFSEKEPLYNNIQKMAVQAAAEDNRFKAVRARELNHLQIEISVLSPREKIEGPDNIVIGKHGIYLINGIRRATLLPQVAIQNNYSPVEFLEVCAESKLGMSRNSWKDSELYVYEAIIIR